MAISDRPAGPTDPVWWRSPYDGQLHLFRIVGAVAAALCTHSVPVADLVEPVGEEQPRCMACLLDWGTELTGRHGDRDRYA